MKIITLAHGPDFAVAKETAEADVAQVMLHQPGIVIGGAKQIFAAAVAAAQATPKHGGGLQRFTGAMQQFIKILAGGTGIAALKLQGLTGTRQGADSNGAIVRISPDEIADEKIAAMKLVEILVHHHANKKIAARLLLIRVTERFKRLNQYLVRRSVADLVNHVMLGASDGPRLSDRRAALRDHTAQRHAAAHTERHAAVLVHVAV